MYVNKEAFGFQSPFSLSVIWPSALHCLSVGHQWNLATPPNTAILRATISSVRLREETQSTRSLVHFLSLVHPSNSLPANNWTTALCQGLLCSTCHQPRVLMTSQVVSNSALGCNYCEPGSWETDAEMEFGVQGVY